MTTTTLLHDVFQSDATQLADLLNVEKSEPGVWRSDELAEIWRYQLDAPLEFDLAAQLQDAGTTYAESSATTQSPPKTFRALFTHPQPPLGLLKLAKNFAKPHTKKKGNTLPQEIALALYYAAIAVALVYGPERITGLTDAKLRQGFEWAIAQPWLDESTRALFSEGLQHILA